MLIKLNQDVPGIGIDGQEIDLPIHQAMALIETGRAEPTELPTESR